MKKTTLIALALVASATNFAFGQDDARNARRFGGNFNFLALARTEDGKIDLSKLSEKTPQELKDALKKADKDNDGFLTPEEMRDAMPRPQGMGPMGQPGFPGFGPGRFGEAMKDGKLDLSKLSEKTPQELKDALKKADKDNDGFLTPEEMRSAMPRPQGMGPMGQPGFPGFGQGGFGEAMKDRKLDLSKLPEKTPQELKDALKKADKDNDGFLTPEEMRDAMPRPQGMGPMGQPGFPGMGPMGGQPGFPGMGPMGGQPGFPGMGPMGGQPGFPGMGPMGGRAAKLDLSKLPEQMPQDRKDALKKADKDNDGFLSPEEMRDAAPNRFPQVKKLDFINDDKGIVIDKLVEAIKSCDKNNDGVVSAEEKKAALENARKELGPAFPIVVRELLGPEAGFPTMGFQPGQGGFQGMGPQNNQNRPRQNANQNRQRRQGNRQQDQRPTRNNDR